MGRAVAKKDSAKSQLPGFQKLREGVPQTHKEHWAGSYSIHHSREHKPPMFATPSYTDKVESSVAYFGSTTYYVILNQ